MTKADNRPIKSIRREDQVLILSLSGDVDLGCSVQLREYLLGVLSEEPTSMIINMAEVGFMDSSGLATLVEALQLTRRSNSQLKLVGLNRRVRSIFEISRLDGIFEIYDTEDEALAR